MVDPENNTTFQGDSYPFVLGMANTIRSQSDYSNQESLYITGPDGSTVRVDKETYDFYMAATRRTLQSFINSRSSDTRLVRSCLW